MIRVTCSVTGDTAYATSPARAIYAATILDLEAGTSEGYRSFSFHNDETDELIRVVDGSELFLAAKALA